MNIDKLIRFKEKMKKEPVFGVFSKTKDPAFIEIMGYAGFDFVIIDLEHGPNTIQAAQDLVRAAELTGLAPIIRVKDDFPPLIGEALDIGAWGIEVPQINSRKNAQELIQVAKFAPMGMRGVCRFVRAAEYTNTDKKEYLKKSNESIVIIHLEGQDAINNLEEILKVPGIDVVFIGPYDLSQSMGIPGEVDHPDLVKKVREVVEICKKRNMLVGTFVDNQEQARKWVTAGVHYIAYSVDVGIFYDKCNEIVKGLNSFTK